MTSLLGGTAPRRAVLAAVGGSAIAGLAGCGTRPNGPPTSPAPSSPTATTPNSSSPSPSSPSPSSPTSGPETSPPESPEAPESSEAPESPETSDEPTSCAATMSLKQRAGQLLMVGVAVTGATAEQLRILKATCAGSVIMMGNSSIDVAGTKQITDRIRANADPAAGTDILVATDQEGGLVQRLRGPGFDTIPSARTQAGWSDAKLRSEAERWGRQLSDAGVNSCLGPVADVVPPDIGEANEPIAANDRGYGDDPDTVGRKITAVVKGFRAGGQATSLKHFPGLGQVIGNTDFATKVVDDRTTADDPLLESFMAGIEAGSDMVMMSTAYYSKIDGSAPAAFSSTVTTELLRGTLGWDGVVISDDLGVAKAVAYLSPGERALAFLRAGGDLIVNVDPATCEEMADAIVAEAEQDQAFADELIVKADRVLKMKTSRGLAACKPQ